MIETKKHFEAGDVCMVFGQPLKLASPIGQAKLVKKISENEIMEHWFVEFLNDEGHTYEAFIKKLNGKK
jgi:hypothetical protein